MAVAARLWLATQANGSIPVRRESSCKAAASWIGWLDVTDLDEPITFCSQLFATEPAKVRPGYAKFAFVEPPLKVVLIEDHTQASGTLNHLGVEVETTADVVAVEARLDAAGRARSTETKTACCSALQDKVRVDGPGAESWEISALLGGADVPAGRLRSAGPGKPTCPAAANTPPEHGR